MLNESDLRSEGDDEPNKEGDDEPNKEGDDEPNKEGDDEPKVADLVTSRMGEGGAAT